MKRGFVVLFAFFSLFSLSMGVVAIGITPSDQRLDYLPGEQVVARFTVSNTAQNPLGIALSLGGSLLPYTQPHTLQPISFEPGEARTYLFNVTLPFTNRLAGQQTLTLTATEQLLGGDASGGITAMASVTAEAMLFVPYPDKYLLASMDAENINIGEMLVVNFHFVNQGRNPIGAVRAVFSVNDAENTVVYEKTITLSGLQPGTQRDQVVTIPASMFAAGAYHLALASLYDGLEAPLSEQDLTIGHYSVVPTSVPETLLSNTINRINLGLQNEWNGVIDDAVVTFLIYSNDGNTLAEVTSGAYYLTSLSSSVYPLYIDTAGLPTGTYRAEVKVSYGDQTTSKEFSVRIVRPASEQNIRDTLLIIGLILALLIFEYIVVRKKYGHSRDRL